MLYDVFGLGNAIVDFTINVKEEFITKKGLRKGRSNIVDADKADEILTEVSYDEISPGGSVSNTLASLSYLGSKVIFYGKVGDDEYGKYYSDELRKEKIEARMKTGDKATGKAICLITPDAERTFVTYLGASVDISWEDIANKDISNSKVIHLTSYQLGTPLLRETAFKLAEQARKLGKTVSFDLADPGFIENNREHVRRMGELADVIFANEDEALAYAGMEDPEKLGANISIIKKGDKGSVIYENGAIHYIEPHKVDAVDSTGAGDTYAAVILKALANGEDLMEAGRKASYWASMIVAKRGARLTTE